MNFQGCWHWSWIDPSHGLRDRRTAFQRWIRHFGTNNVVFGAAWLLMQCHSDSSVSFNILQWGSFCILLIPFVSFCFQGYSMLLANVRAGITDIHWISLIVFSFFFYCFWCSPISILTPFIFRAKLRVASTGRATNFRGIFSTGKGALDDMR